MKVEFWGAARTVTGSMHLLHFNGKRILLDCGMYQGKRKEAFERNRQLPFDAASIDFVILSHAHIDHSGNLPSLVKSGFRGPIYSTSATRDLCGILLLDSAKIQESDVNYVNKKRIKNGQTPFEPLYIADDAIATMKRFRTVDFYDSFSPMPGLKIQFHVAGHMLGAAHVELVLDEGHGQPPTRLVFSGDIGRPNVPILQDPVCVKGADYLIMEATYGDRVHDKLVDPRDVLAEALNEVAESGGRLIIPAFSVGRTQEMVYYLNLLKNENRLPPIPVFADSPLAIDATDIYRANADCFDKEFRESILEDNPFSFEGLHYVRRAEDSKAINSYGGPCVILSASGMCEGGRILHHLKNNIEKPNTIILFAGFQATDTLGRIIFDQSKKEIHILGESFKPRAKVLKLEGCSGHSDQQEMLAWATAIAEHGNLKQVALVHCEFDAASTFKQLLLKSGIEPVVIPERGETIELSAF